MDNQTATNTTSDGGASELVLLVVTYGALLNLFTARWE